MILRNGDRKRDSLSGFKGELPKLQSKGFNSISLYQHFYQSYNYKGNLDSPDFDGEPRVQKLPNLGSIDLQTDFCS